MSMLVPIWISVLCSSGNRCYGESLILFSNEYSSYLYLFAFLLNSLSFSSPLNLTILNCLHTFLLVDLALASASIRIASSIGVGPITSTLIIY